jgi:hypothetical protein
MITLILGIACKRLKMDIDDFAIFLFMTSVFDGVMIYAIIDTKL